MNQTVGSSAASVASSVSDSRRSKRTSSSTKKVNRSRNYACSKCGQPKKGLEFMDLNMLEDVNVMSDIFNPTRNESYVEEQDMNQTVGSSAASVASSVSDSRRSKRTSSSTKKVNRSRNYACSKCGQPKKGHVCPLAPVSPPKMVSMSTQVDLNVTHIERVLVTRPFRSFSMS
jgi:predicted SprT family Zn-dependent metalloprotease